MRRVLQKLENTLSWNTKLPLHLIRRPYSQHDGVEITAATSTVLSQGALKACHSEAPSNGVSDVSRIAYQRSYVTSQPLPTMPLQEGTGNPLRRHSQQEATTNDSSLRSAEPSLGQSTSDTTPALVAMSKAEWAKASQLLLQEAQQAEEKALPRAHLENLVIAAQFFRDQEVSDKAFGYLYNLSPDVPSTTVYDSRLKTLCAAQRFQDAVHLLLQQIPSSKLGRFHYRTILMSCIREGQHEVIRTVMSHLEEQLKEASTLQRQLLYSTGTWGVRLLAAATLGETEKMFCLWDEVSSMPIGRYSTAVLHSYKVDALCRLNRSEEALDCLKKLAGMKPLDQESFTDEGVPWDQDSRSDPWAPLDLEPFSDRESPLPAPSDGPNSATASDSCANPQHAMHDASVAPEQDDESALPLKETVMNLQAPLKSISWRLAMKTSANAVLRLAEASDEDTVLARKLRAIMQGAGLDVGRSAHPKLLRVAKKQGATAAELDKFLQKLEAESGSPSCQSAYVVVLHSYREEKDVQGAHRLLQRMLDANLQPDTVTYGVVLHIHAALGDVTTANELFEHMLACNLTPNVYVFAALFLCVKNAAWHVRRQEGRLGLSPSRRERAAWPLAQRKNELAEQLERYLQLVKHYRVNYMFNIDGLAIETYGLINQPAKLLQLVEESMKHSATATQEQVLRLYTAALKSLSFQATCLTTLIEVMHQMTDMGLPLTESAYVALFDCCFRDTEAGGSKGVAVAKATWKQLHEDGFPPTQVLYNRIVVVMAKAGLFDDAYALVNTMASEGHLPYPRTWRLLEMEALKCKHSEHMRKVKGLRTKIGEDKTPMKHWL